MSPVGSASDRPSAPHAGSEVDGERLLTPLEAAAVVDTRIEQFGPGALPSVSVTGLADGHWIVRWECLERTVAPMGLAAWTAWLEEHVGSLDAASLDTSEG